jgi:large subunit ribosomal protein L21e
MPHSHGKRAQTRYQLAKGFRKHGRPNLTTFLTNYKIGDYVDIVANPTQHKGMPFKRYHGRTGNIFNVSKRAGELEPMPARPSIGR